MKCLSFTKRPCNSVSPVPKGSSWSIIRHIHLTFEHLVVLLLLSWFLLHWRCDCWRHHRWRHCCWHDRRRNRWRDHFWSDCRRSLRRLLIWITCFIQMSNFECNKCSYIKMDQKRGSTRVAQSSWKIFKGVNRPGCLNANNQCGSDFFRR